MTFLELLDVDVDGLREKAEPAHWCCSHVAVEDHNLDDDSIQWCLDNGNIGQSTGSIVDGPGGRACDNCREVLEALLGLPLALRYLALGHRRRVAFYTGGPPRLAFVAGKGMIPRRES